MREESIAPGRSNPLWGPMAILLAGLSLSIGWGIRGNYGHEVGAMFPGALTAIAVCLLSGREDWRERLAYFACFGAIGWAFGGSISYMQVLAYSQSGHAPSQYYGYWGLFVIGFLWAALGGAGTAFPAILDRKSLADLFKPLSLLLAIWCLLYFVEAPLTDLIDVQFGRVTAGLHAARRHESVLYWFDSDWLSVFVILIGILVFDLAERRFGNSLWLPVMAAVGGAIGHLAQVGMTRAGWSERLTQVLVHVQGDPTAFDRNRLMMNWPEFFVRESNYIGAAVGVALGVGVYFAIFGRFRCGSSLCLSMALGWFGGFLVLPVLLDVRMTPPRGDNWAGILGAYVGLVVYLIRQKLWPIVVVSLIAGAIGGIGLSGIACLQSVLESFGNPSLSPAFAQSWTDWQLQPAAPFPPDFLVHVQPSESWRFWHQANWHSFLEQSFGFVNGVGLIVAMGLVVRRVGRVPDEGRRPYWTEIVAVTLALPVVLYVNVVKNVAVWTSGNPSAVPKVMRAPLIGFPISAWGWFNILFGTAALAFVMLLSIHRRRRLAILNQSWLGRGQLFFIVLLWAFVIANFGRALTGFREQRLLTEGVITLNAVLATMMVLLVPRSAAQTPEPTSVRFGPMIGACLAVALLAAVVVPPLSTVVTRAIDGDAPARRVGRHGPQTRFGPRAVWKRTPLLRGADHI